MAKVGINNVNHSSPKWLVNLTGALAIITPILPSFVQTMPGSVSDTTKDWILWVMSIITGLSAAITMLTKSKHVSS